MTKVQKHFSLQRPLDEALMVQIAAANAIYGIENIRILPSREELMVEYDASRLRAPDVEVAASCSCGGPRHRRRPRLNHSHRAPRVSNPATLIGRCPVCFSGNFLFG